MRKEKESASENEGIGVYAESGLHASLKLLVSEAGDRFEAKVGGKVADILKASGEIIEIQTGAFGRLPAKIKAFRPGHPVRIVYPVSLKKTILTLDPVTGAVLSRRKSPKKGKAFDVFSELVHFPELLLLSGVSLELVFVEIEEIRVKDGRGSWRRRFISIHDRRLGQVIDRLILSRPRDLLRLLDGPLPAEFTSTELGALAGGTSRLGGQAAYVLSRMGLAEAVGKRGRSILYRAAAKSPRKRRIETR